MEKANTQPIPTFSHYCGLVSCGSVSWYHCDFSFLPVCDIKHLPCLVRTISLVAITVWLCVSLLKLQTVDALRKSYKGQGMGERDSP